MLRLSTAALSSSVRGSMLELLVAKLTLVTRVLGTAGSKLLDRQTDWCLRCLLLLAELVVDVCCLGSGEQLSDLLRSARARWFRRSSSCWLHLMFCSRSVWFCCSSSRSLFVTHSLMRAAFASTCLASWRRNWRCSSTSPSRRWIWTLFGSLCCDHASFCSIIRTCKHGTVGQNGSRLQQSYRLPTSDTVNSGHNLNNVAREASTFLIRF